MISAYANYYFTIFLVLLGVCFAGKFLYWHVIMLFILWGRGYLHHPVTLLRYVSNLRENIFANVLYYFVVCFPD